jgi:hypothetical protein
MRVREIFRCVVCALGILAGVATSEMKPSSVATDNAVVFAQDLDVYCDNVPMGCSSYGCWNDYGTWKCALASNVPGVSCGAPACKKIGELE